MPTKDKEGGEVNLPISITWRDIITVVTITVTLTTAWGVFSTRVSLLEKDNVSAHEKLKDMKDVQKQQDARQTQMENRLRDNEAAIEDLWKNTKRVSP